MIDPTPEMVRNYTKTMQAVDAIMGWPIRLTESVEEYEAQRDELAELLETRWRVYA